jgi:hypothetical protein
MRTIRTGLLRWLSRADAGARAHVEAWGADYVGSPAPRGLDL